MLCGSIILYLLLAGPSRRKEMFCSVCNNTNALPEGWFMAFLRRHRNNLWSRKHVKCPHSRNIKRSFYVPSFIISTLTAAHRRSWNCHSHSWILHTCFPSVAPKSERAVPETLCTFCALYLGSEIIPWVAKIHPGSRVIPYTANDAETLMDRCNCDNSCIWSWHIWKLRWDSGH